MAFPVLPSVHLENRRFPDGTGEGSTMEQATALARQYGAVYVTDVNAVRRNQPDVEFLRDLCRNRPVWLDTGPRDLADAMDALMAAPGRLTVRWTAVRRAQDLDELVEVAEPDTCRVMLEFDDGRFVRNPRAPHLDEDAVRKVAQAHGASIVIGATAFDGGLMRRFAPESADAEARTWWYGPLTKAEVTELRRAHYKGVIVPVPLAAEAEEGARDEEVTPE